MNHKSRQQKLKQAKKRFQFDPNKQNINMNIGIMCSALSSNNIKNQNVVVNYNQQQNNNTFTITNNENDNSFKKNNVFNYNKHKNNSKKYSQLNTSQLPSSIQIIDVDSQQLKQNQQQSYKNNIQLLPSQKIIVKSQQCSKHKTTNNNIKNNDYSSVNQIDKFQQQYQNQSSWLANLVHGIQQLYSNNNTNTIHQNYYQEKPLTIISSQNTKSNKLLCFSKHKSNTNHNQMTNSNLLNSNQKSQNKDNRKKIKTQYSNHQSFKQSFKTSNRSSFNLKKQHIHKISQNNQTKISQQNLQNNSGSKNIQYKCPNPTPILSEKRNLLNNSSSKKSTSSNNYYGSRKHSIQGLPMKAVYRQSKSFRSNQFNNQKKQSKLSTQKREIKKGLSSKNKQNQKNKEIVYNSNTNKGSQVSKNSLIQKNKKIYQIEHKLYKNSQQRLPLNKLIDNQQYLKRKNFEQNQNNGKISCIRKQRQSMQARIRKNSVLSNCSNNDIKNNSGTRKDNEKNIQNENIDGIKININKKIGGIKKNNNNNGYNKNNNEGDSINALISFDDKQNKQNSFLRRNINNKYELQRERCKQKIRQNCNNKSQQKKTSRFTTMHNDNNNISIINSYNNDKGKIYQIKKNKIIDYKSEDQNRNENRFMKQIGFYNILQNNFKYNCDNNNTHQSTINYQNKQLHNIKNNSHSNEKRFKYKINQIQHYNFQVEAQNNLNLIQQNNNHINKQQPNYQIYNNHKHYDKLLNQNLNQNFHILNGFSIPKQQIIDIFYKLNPNRQKYLTSQLIKQNQHKIYQKYINTNNGKDKIMISILKSIFIQLRIIQTQFNLQQFVNFIFKISKKYSNRTQNNKQDFERKLKSKSNQKFNQQIHQKIKQTDNLIKNNNNNSKNIYLTQNQHLNNKQFNTYYQSKKNSIDQTFRRIDIIQNIQNLKNREQNYIKSDRNNKNSINNKCINFIPLQNNLNDLDLKLKYSQQKYNFNSKSYQKLQIYDKVRNVSLQNDKFNQDKRQNKINWDNQTNDKLNKIYQKYQITRNHIKNSQHNQKKQQNINKNMKSSLPAYGLSKNPFKDIKISTQTLKINSENTRLNKSSSNQSFTQYQNQRLQQYKSKNKQLQHKLEKFHNRLNISLTQRQQSCFSRQKTDQLQLIPDKKKYLQGKSCYQSSSIAQSKQSENDKSFMFPVIIQQEQQEKEIPFKQPYLQINSTALIQPDEHAILNAIGILNEPLSSEKQPKSLSNSDVLLIIRKMSQHPQIMNIYKDYLFNQKMINTQELSKYRCHSSYNQNCQGSQSQPWTVRNLSQNQSNRNNNFANTMYQDKNILNKFSDEINFNSISIIQKLNKKLSKYIETNHLQDTNKSLKFNFHELKKNLNI